MPPLKVATEVVRQFLEERQRVKGGVTGEDIVSFAREHGLHPIAFRRRVLRLLVNDPRLSAIHYLGKHPPVLDLAEFARVLAGGMGKHCGPAAYLRVQVRLAPILQ